MFICIKQGFFFFIYLRYLCVLLRLDTKFLIFNGQVMFRKFPAQNLTFLWRKLIGCEIVWSFKQPKLVCIAFRLRNDLSYFLTIDWHGHFFTLQFSTQPMFEYLSMLQHKGKIVQTFNNTNVGKEIPNTASMGFVECTVPLRGLGGFLKRNWCS